MTDSPSRHDWPRAGACAGSAALRSMPEDFVVVEQSSPEFSGSGEHLWLKIRKRGHNTDHIARELARLAGVPARNVGYAGRKDRHAVTTQWFSMQLPGRPDPELDGLPADVEVLEQHRHQRKLQTGYLDGNAFELILREVKADRELLEQRLADIRDGGVPNYFGTQRFGLAGGNLERAREWFAGERRVKERGKRSMMLSAARSFLFNEVLAERVRRSDWQQLLLGDRAMLGTGRSHFLVEALDESIATRLQAREIHPSGPLWGRGSPQTEGDIESLEMAVAERHRLFCDGLERNGLDAQRRALRVIPAGLTWEWLADDVIRLGFSLPAGCFATSVLAEVLECHDCLSGTGGETTE